MSTFHTSISHRSKKPIRVTAPKLLPDGKTYSGIEVHGSGWTLALDPDEARNLATLLTIAAGQAGDE